MKVVTVLTCPSCGAHIDANPGDDITFCKFCGSRLAIEDKDVPEPTEHDGSEEEPSGTRRIGETGRAWLTAFAVVGLVAAGTVAMSSRTTDGGEDPVTQSITVTSSQPNGTKDTVFTSKPDTLADELLAIGMRYRPSGEAEHREQWGVIKQGDLAEDPGNDWRFAAGVIAAAQTISEPDGMGSSTLDMAIGLTEKSAGNDAERVQFAELLKNLRDGGYQSQPWSETYAHKPQYDGGSQTVYYNGSNQSGQTTQGASDGRNSNGHSHIGWTPQDILDQATDEAGGSMEEDDHGAGDFLSDLFDGDDSKPSSSNSGTARATDSASESATDSQTTNDTGGETHPTSTAQSETYAPIAEPGFMSVATNPLSTVSADADTASYANFRRQVREGATVDGIYDDSVRVEEWLNYFDYDYASPADGDLFGITPHLGKCPWNDSNQLLTIGLSTDREKATPEGGRNVVFLVDVSGSMDEWNKLPLLQDALVDVVGKFGEDDRISLVTYSSDGQVVFSGKSGADRDEVISKIDGLSASGTTNGGEGLQRAYEAAEANFIMGGVNRIILCSDGDMNLGTSTTGELTDLVSEKRNRGIYLSVLGFGTGNYHDQNMEAIADNGNGNYHYIDCLDEAKKVLDDEFASTMVPVADDVKIQVEFNPANVKAYRLIGYVNRTLQAKDFRDDSKDAGEIGASQAFTVAYEIVPAGSEEDPTGGIELRYGGGNGATTGDDASDASYEELSGISCLIGGKPYPQFSYDRTDYEITFPRGSMPYDTPTISNLPEGWEVSGGTTSTEGSGAPAYELHVRKGDLERTYTFRYKDTATTG